MFLGFYVLNGVVWWIHQCADGVHVSPLDKRWGLKLEDNGEFSVVPAAPNELFSLLCRSCGCHGYITNGQWVDVS